MSEKVIGQFKCDYFEIISKLPSFQKRDFISEENIISQVNKSLELLNKKSIYAYLIHDSSDLFSEKRNIILKSLDKIKKYDLAKKVGISIYDPLIIPKLLEIYPFDIIQTPFNIVDKRLINQKNLEVLNNKNIEIHVRSIFLQGMLLLNKIEQRKISQYKGFFKIWNDWLKYNKLSKVQACLSFVNSIEAISKIIIGIDNISHLKQILKTEIKSLDQIPDWSDVIDDILINPFKWNFKRVYEK